MILSAVLLANGSLAGLIRGVVRHLTRNDDAVVNVYGGASDIFGNTRVDSVIVTNPQGLFVGVYGAGVTGSVPGFLTGRRVDRIHVDSLVIITPEPSDQPPDSSLAPIFQNTMAGIVTRAHSVVLDYGRIEDYNGCILVDSMHLDAGILSISPSVLAIRKASSLIPEFGMVGASGALEIHEDRVVLDDISLVSPPGTLSASGTLNHDSSFTMSFAGELTTSFSARLPAAVCGIEGFATGTIQNPYASIAVTDGLMNHEGVFIGFSADSILASLDGIRLVSLSLRSGPISVSVTGELDLPGLEWRGTLSIDLDRLDMSSFIRELPSTSINGFLHLSAFGREASPESATLGGNLSRSQLNGYSFDTFEIYCNATPDQITGSITTAFPQGDISARFQASLGMGFLPVSWSADLQAYLADGGILSAFTDPQAENARGISADLTGRGAGSSFSSRGTVSVESFSNESLFVQGAGFTGGFSHRSGRFSAAGDAFAQSSVYGDSSAWASSLFSALDVEIYGNAVSATCSLGVSEGGFGEISLKGLGFTGDVELQGGDLTGEGILSSDSVFMGGAPYGFEAAFTAFPGSVHLDSLRIESPDQIVLQLAGMFGYGPDFFDFSLEGITLNRGGKLRLISSGDLEFSADRQGLHLDTLWLDLPSGEISATGSSFGDTLCLDAGFTGVDVASLASMLGTSFPLSGILSARFTAQGVPGDLLTSVSSTLLYPSFREWVSSDSITLEIHTAGDSLVLDGLWSWTDGIRSGVRLGMDGIWNRESGLELDVTDIAWLEAELSGVGDELFYLLPIPLRTYGASVSARIEYSRDTAELSAGVASHFTRLYLTNPGIEFPGVSMYFTYPHIQEDTTYNGRLTLNSGTGQNATLETSLLIRVEEDLTFSEETLPLSLKAYDFRSDFSQWPVLIAGIGWLEASGTVSSRSSDLEARPRITGKIAIDRAQISMGGGGTFEGGGNGGSSSPEQLPVDLSIRITGDRGIWFRTGYANVELSTSLDLTTVNGFLSLGGDVRAVRGSVFLLGREFQITEGEVRILESAPPEIELHIKADARIRSTVSGGTYIITVTVYGDPEDPEIGLSGMGPAGAISEQDMVALLTAGMTYGELQQFDSSALGSVAGTYLGQWLAGSIRDDVGLDALQFTPDFSSDTTSLVVNAGKYVLPDLFVSFTSDVFSSDAGTIRAQYFFSRDFFLEGSTKSTLTGRHDPSIELHYTFRY
jgi:hypothetical protein